MALAELDCQSRLVLLQKSQKDQLGAAAAEAAAKLAGQQEAAAAQLAACEAALQQQLAEAVAAGRRELQRQREQHAATAAEAARHWEGLCTQLASKMLQLAANLASDPQQVWLSLEDALLAPASLPGDPAGSDAEDSSSSSTGQGALAAAHAMAAVHDALQQLYCAVLDVRSQLASTQLGASGLQQMVGGLQQQAADERQRWQQRLQQELRQRDLAWEVRASEQVATEAATWRAKLAEAEAGLHAELAQVTATLAAAQHNRQELERQCSQLASELLAVQQAAAAGLEAAAARAASQQRQAVADAAEAAGRAAEQQAAAEQSLRQDMQVALARLAEQHTEAMQAALRRHEEQLDEARRLAEQAAQHHEQASGGVQQALGGLGSGCDNPPF